MDLLSRLQPFLPFDDPNLPRILLAVAMGIVLAATCGLRAFLPLFGVSVMAWLDQVELSEGFTWLNSPITMLAFGTAVVLELLADKFPAVDHVMDAIGLVARPLAGTLVVASLVGTRDPMVACVLGLATGGVAAGGVQLVKAKVRLLSTTFTAGLGNALVSLLEDLLAVVTVVVTLVLPLVAIGAVALLGLSLWAWRRRKRRALA